LPDDWILGYALRGVNMDADELRELLDRYVAGELSPEEREAFRRALDTVREKVEGVEERVGRLDGEITDRVDRAVEKLNAGLAEGGEKFRRKLDLLDELNLARRIEEKLHRVVLFRAPENLGAAVMRGVCAEKRPKVVIPPMRRSPMPAVLLGGGLLVALTVGAAAILPMFGVNLGVNLGGLPDWLCWIPAGLSACFGAGMVLRTLLRSRNDPAFRTAAKKG
jgi:anti-sigma factor RsiW